MSFAALKKNRTNDITKLVSAAEKLTTKQSFGDDRFWNPTIDKAGNGFAIIRFLPAPTGEDLPWVRFWDHGFKGSTGRWYIEKSLTSVGQPDPVGEMNAVLWNSGLESDKEIARARKRRLHYVSNILVISDSGNPENEGKVFLYKYGKKIFDKAMDVMQPAFADETPINPFDFWAGADFKLKIRQVEGYRNYDKSEFAQQSEMFKGDESKIERVYDELLSLSEFTDPAKYKSYADLKKKMVEVLGDEAFIADNISPSQRVELNSPAANPNVGRSEREPLIAEEVEDDDDNISYFAQLAAQD